MVCTEKYFSFPEAQSAYIQGNNQDVDRQIAALDSGDPPPKKNY